MKNAIVYYSMSGNTKYAVEKIAKKLDADLIELEPVKAYPTKGLAKFFHGGKAAVFGDMPELKPYTFDSSLYEKVVIACPVWASKCAPPINSFLQKYGKDLSEKGGKSLGIILCQSGNGADKVLESYKEKLQVKEFAAELVLIDPLKQLKKQAENAEKIEQFCKKME